MIGCKKEDPKPAPTPTLPPPITSASTSFNLKANGTFLRITTESMEIKNWTGSGDPSRDTTVTKVMTTQNITFSVTGQVTAQYPYTLTINSGHKSYTFIDSINKPERTIALW